MYNKEQATRENVLKGTDIKKRLLKRTGAQNMYHIFAFSTQTAGTPPLFH